MSDSLGDIGLRTVAASLAPHDQPNLRGKRLAQGQRFGLPFGAFTHHTEIMPQLADDDKAILAELLRETIARE